MARRPKIKRWPTRPKPKHYGQQPNRVQKVKIDPKMLVNGTSGHTPDN
jgi:hypothetical protein